MSNYFDLDVTFEDSNEEPDLSKIKAEDLKRVIDQLPEALRGVATGLLLEKRTMSDVSQDLGIRQGELVTRLHRAMLFIGMNLNKR